MSALATFDFEGTDVRVQDLDGEPWFVGKDVCGCLDLSNHNKALGQLDDDERKGVTISYPLGKNPQTMICINEPGIFQLVFTSRTDAAKRFKRWLAHEVLPEIRRSGTYSLVVPDNDEPVTPPVEDMEIEERRQTVAEISLCRRIFGRSAAQQLWLQSKLAKPEAPAMVSREVAPDIIGWWRGRIGSGVVLPQDDAWRTEVPAHEVCECYRRETGQQDSPGLRARFGRALREIVPGVCRVQRTDRAGRTWSYILPDLDTCRDHLERVTGQQVPDRQDINGFARENLVSAPGETISARALYDAYTKWCSQTRIPAVNETRFGRGLAELGYRKEKRGNIQYLDIALMN